MNAMSTWTWLLIVGFGLIKMPIALLMLWLPFRSDESVVSSAPAEPDDTSGEDEGGSKTLPGAPHDPRPHRPHPRPRLRGPSGPRRGPHGAPAPPSPARSRHARATPRRATRIGA
jgi:hypothetical protein